MAIRVLYSFPHSIGAGQICYTAWEQVRGLCAGGADVLVMPRAIRRPIPGNPRVQPTLAVGNFRIPYKLFGLALAHLHDRIVARRLEKLAPKIDIVHCWPSSSLETLRTAKRLGIPTVLERPNAHTRFCYEVTEKEYARLGIPAGRNFQSDPDVLIREEAEFAVADYLLCPSEFTLKSFVRQGFPPEKLIRHQYGYDETRFFPESASRDENKQFCALFVGIDTVRKGLGHALEAWVHSPASKNGIFKIVGKLSPEFEKRFEKELADVSVMQLGVRHDIPLLMRQADVLLLPTIEEGFPLVCAEAVGSGCVPLVSTVCTDVCKSMVNSLVHEVGDVSTLSEQITMLFQDPVLLATLRSGALKSRYKFTWAAAGTKLLDQYSTVLNRRVTVPNLPQSYG